MSLSTRTEWIGPKKAERYLKLNTNNRRVRQAWVDELARMMKAGEFEHTHQGIAFNCDGTLKDGQHRLQAIFESGCTVRMQVTRGVTGDAMKVIDTGAKRRIEDIEEFRNAGIHSSHVAVATSMMQGPSSEWIRFTRLEKAEYLSRHEEAIRFAVAATSSARGVCRAPVRAVIARAWYSADRDRLDEFTGILCGETPKGKSDSAANSLLRYLLSQNAGGHVVSIEIYQKTESALLAFLEHRPMTKIYGSSVELFPIDDDIVSK